MHPRKEQAVSTGRLVLTHPHGGDPTVVPVAACAAIAEGVYPSWNSRLGGFAGRPARLEDRLTGLGKIDDNTMTQVGGADPGP